MDYSPPRSSIHGIFQARILEWGCYFPLQGIFLTQGSNPSLLSLLHWQVDPLPLVPPGKHLLNTGVLCYCPGCMSTEPALPLNISGKSHPTLVSKSKCTHILLKVFNVGIIWERILLWNFVCMWKSLSHAWLFVAPWTVAHQALLSLGFTRQEYWRMGNTCKSMADWCQCMAKTTTIL